MHKIIAWLGAVAPNLLLAAALFLASLVAWSSPAAAARHPAQAALHIPGSTGKVTPSEQWHPTRIGGVKASGPGGLVVSGARFSTSPAAASCSGNNLCYQPAHGPVQTQPRVYLVLWGTWWNCTAPSCANKNPKSGIVENYLYKYWHQIGQPGEIWSTITSQYFDSTGHHPSFGHGVWGTACSHDGNNNCGWVAWQQDPPTSPTDNDLSNMAATAAAYFGITNDQNAQIVILTPKGVQPQNTSGSKFPQAGFGCANHGYSPTAGNVAYAVMPWLPDSPNCGASFPAKAPPKKGGWSYFGGHEFAEMITDPLGTSWYTAPVSSGEIGDKCMNSPFHETMPNGKVFLQQKLWSNVDSGCVQTLQAGEIRNLHSLLCVDNAGARTTNSNKIETWSCNNSSAQTILYTPGSGHLVVNGKCLDVAGQSRNKGAKIILYQCTSNQNQNWHYDATSHEWQVYGGLGGIGAMCLDVPNGSSTPGTQLQIWDCNGGNAQMWSRPGQ
jgi:hypothetical protein